MHIYIAHLENYTNFDIISTTDKHPFSQNYGEKVPQSLCTLLSISVIKHAIGKGQA